MTAVATQDRSPRGVILSTVEGYAEQIGQLAPRGVGPGFYLASLRLYLAQNEKVLDCTPVSIAKGILRVAQTGLTLGESCDLLPFGKECQFNPRYNGIIELALAAGVRTISANVVREGDKFEFEYGTNPHITHVPLAKSSAPITHAYAIAQIKMNSFVFEVATREDIDALRKRYSKSWKNQSLDDIPWYARKTMVRKLAPYMPKNARLAAALQFAAESDEVPAGDADFEVLDEGVIATAPSIEAGKDSAPELSALDRAKATALIGEPGSWGGQAGKQLDSFSTKHLESIRKWFATKLEEKGDNEDFELMVDAITMILVNREPKMTSEFPNTPSFADTPDMSAGIAANESRAQAVGL